MEGWVQVRSSGVRKHWKKRHAALFLTPTHYCLVISDLRTGGVRTVAASEKEYRAPLGSLVLEEYPKHQFAFVLHVQPQDSASPVLYVAAMNETEYFEWMSAFTRVSFAGEKDTSTNSEGSPLNRMPSTAEQQEASDLELALERSTREL